MTIPLWVRRIVRPLIPDRVMARFRLIQHSRRVRSNVDVVLDDHRAAKRWLATTPDTYRVRPLSSFGPAPAFTRIPPEEAARILPDNEAVLVIAPPGFDAEEVARLARSLADPALGAAVAAEVATPRLVRRRRAEPPLAPVAIALRGAAWIEVDGVPDHGAPLPALLDRLRSAGHAIALHPRPPAKAPFHRDDPIDGPSAVVLSAVPMHDVGGGSRSAQIAIELLRHGVHVTYGALFSADESVDLGQRYLHPYLEQVRTADLDIARIGARLGRDERVALIEVPAPPLLPIATAMADAGYRMVYDIIDDWSDPSLGGEWYRPDVEQAFIDLADAVVASAPDLVVRARRMGVEAILVPNGVNDAIFGRPVGPVPEDFPQGEGPVLGYQGSLYGDWFDWAGIAAVAASRPDARVVIIGDHGKGHPALPTNVHFLGLKAHDQLPDYVARFDVGLVPFVVSEVTHAVSPLKAYEYLACGVPVAAPRLRALEGLDGIFVADALGAAVTAALDGQPPDRKRALAGHSWQGRLAAIAAVAGFELPARGGRPPTIVRRPPRHYGKHERRID